MQVEIVAELLGELSKAMVERRWEDVDGLINPKVNDITYVRYSLRDVLKVAKLNIKALELNPFISKEVREAAVVEVQMVVSQIMKFTSDVVHAKYESDEFDVFLYNFFDSQHEWLALAAIAAASPCADVKYEVLAKQMEGATMKVKYAYNDFISRRVNCPKRGVKSTASSPASKVGYSQTKMVDFTSAFPPKGRRAPAASPMWV